MYAKALKDSRINRTPPFGHICEAYSLGQSISEGVFTIDNVLGQSISEGVFTIDNVKLKAKS